MKWRDISPGWTPQPRERLPEPLVERIEARLRHAADGSTAICVDLAAAAAVQAHLGTCPREQGGLLVGETFRLRDGHLLVRVCEAVAAVEFDSSPVALRMDAQVWTHARDRLRGERLIVGWYHSHPDLGAFFSGTDRRTQAAFFPHEYSLGWVIDPIRAEQAWFLGPQSQPVAAERVESDPGPVPPEGPARS